ncbi:unnamed protein product, partial [Larinioides sclopetarius]
RRSFKLSGNALELNETAEDSSPNWCKDFSSGANSCIYCPNFATHKDNTRIKEKSGFLTFNKKSELLHSGYAESKAAEVF